jgi:hypothetical protein
MEAYDYQAQCWVEGAEAVRVRIAQLENDLAILRSEAGPEFCLATGIDRTRTTRAAARELRLLRSAPAQDIASCDNNHVTYYVD